MQQVVLSSSSEFEDEGKLEQRKEALRRKEIFYECGFSGRSDILPKYVRLIIEHYKWEALASLPMCTSNSLIRDFYLGLQPEKDISMFRGVQVDFSVGAINEVYTVPDEGGDECRRRMYAPTKEQVAKALKLVALKGANAGHYS